MELLSPTPYLYRYKENWAQPTRLQAGDPKLTSLGLDYRGSLMAHWYCTCVRVFSCTGTHAWQAGISLGLKREAEDWISPASQNTNISLDKSTLLDKTIKKTFLEILPNFKLYIFENNCKLKKICILEEKSVEDFSHSLNLFLSFSEKRTESKIWYFPNNLHLNIYP